MNFQGETGPYIQYIYVRTKSILDNVNELPAINEISVDELNNEEALRIFKLIYQFESILENVVSKNEPSILSRYLINLAQAYSSYYNSNKILIEDTEKKNARIYLTYMVGNILQKGAGLLGIDMPEKM